MILKGRLRLDLDLRRYFEIETIVSLLTQKGLWYYEDKPARLKFDFGYCEQMVEKKLQKLQER